MGVIDDIKQKIDIVEVVSQYTTLTKAGRTFRALCPFHSEKHPSFFVYPEQQSWHCFGACNTGGDIFSFITKKEGLTFGEALRLLAQRAGVSIPSRSAPDTRKDEKERLYQANEAAAQYFHNLLLSSPAGERTKNYLISRGISLKSTIDFQLGFSPNSWEALKLHLWERGYTEGELLEAGLIIAIEDGKTHDRFRNRLMFPIFDSRGRITGFGARALDDSLPKYLNSPQTPIFDKSDSLYGINLATPAIRQHNQTVIVEGYIDVIIAQQSGFNNVVASMGTSVTDEQISALKRLKPNITLALDADTAGEEAMLRCLGYESAFETKIKVATLPRGKDPDDIIREDVNTWQHLVEEALPVVDYTINMVTAQLDLTTAEGKSSATDRLLPIIAEIKDEIRRDHYLTRLSRLTGISYNRLETALSRVKARQRAKEPKPETPASSRYWLRFSPLEEYCLALVLQHPELKMQKENLLPEYFENSENREVFLVWQQTEEKESLRAKLDSTIWEHFDTLINKSIPTDQIEQKYAHCILRLRERSLRDLEAKKAEARALAAEAGGTAAELAKLQEQGIDVSRQLREVFTQEARIGQRPRR